LIPREVQGRVAAGALLGIAAQVGGYALILNSRSGTTVGDAIDSGWIWPVLALEFVVSPVGFIYSCYQLGRHKTSGCACFIRT
jgi:hypothetical protein